jgi:hypothetical protein
MDEIIENFRLQIHRDIQELNQITCITKVVSKEKILVDNILISET